jgi:hypothetical protein
LVEDVPGVPVHQINERHGKPLQIRQIVELKTKNAFGLDPVAEQFPHHLIQRGQRIPLRRVTVVQS